MKKQSQTKATLFSQHLKNEHFYTSDEIDDFLSVALSGFDDLPFYKTSGKDKSELLNIPCSFDIETTSTYIKDEKIATMYVWMLGINGLCIVGRKWEQFINVCDIIANKLELNEQRRIVIYVHNLAFEFGFINRWFEWAKIFAIDARKPVYAITTTGIEFRCSLILSGYSLENVGNNLLKYKVAKMIGDLDYSLIRHSDTPLTLKEWGYCLNDIRVVMAYIQEKIETDGDITKIQLTKTGYVRKLCRDACFGNNHKKCGAQMREYQRFIHSLNINSIDEYKQAKRAFQGGFTHANYRNAGKTMYNADSNDFTSSYPASMLMGKYPVSSGEIVEITSNDDFQHYLKCYCCLFDLHLYDVCEKDDVYENYLSSSKCLTRGFCYENNGRIIMADELITTVTDIDYQIIEEFYTFKQIKVSNFRIYRRGYLPTPIIKTMLELYAKKTTLKGVAGKEDEYLYSKECINSLYGMMVMDCIRPEEQFVNGEWITKQPDEKKQLKDYNHNDRRFTFYLWGVWITAYSRRNLFTAIKELGTDYIYSDTDSVKYINRDAHIDYFNAYDEWVTKQLETALKHHNLPLDSIRPKTIKGVEKPLGVWDWETADGKYTRFKTLGAKRYMTEHNGKINITVAGVNKKCAVPYLIQNFSNPFDAFQNDLKIPKEHTGKLTHTYIEETLSGVLTDYHGNTANFYEKSAVHLEQAEYSLSLTDAYLDLLNGYVEINK